MKKAIRLLSIASVVVAALATGAYAEVMDQRLCEKLDQAITQGWEDASSILLAQNLYQQYCSNQENPAFTDETYAQFVKVGSAIADDGTLTLEQRQLGSKVIVCANNAINYTLKINPEECD
ncbi:MAG: hypothetical protein A2381_09235 [Bdellovibrionales bacterium RIFOXYB1_FULL_37_110]|nr:MAG: hypothetical protein A2181_05990 [Bdellovibrionales bacterium RIFOXYA1_FULL_38_20]OFZ49264.1 MAG: hypothetical protein A2417_17165 [Bdellovibrionales bacterium RIFOXYC1_FULL_37_79]OFZ58273.1 MAG: hypothetical protein A2381_09235 [Bdellovibrionales bacterium RIFOXYB1_FULL_37_110]OFZ61525.1 MAG: hypothetical protein A2577_00445 [Bdellovibrionales bacterium RIFOXYD1_FULL_36_51]